MLLILSPSKTQDFSQAKPKMPPTQPLLLEQSALLAKELKKLDEKKLGALMGISPKLSALNVERYKDFSLPFTETNAKPALLAFRGDVYDGIEADEYGKADFTFAQKHLRILSGFYGVLRPLDLIQPYRLEMSIPLKNPRGKNLYEFWGDRITQALNSALEESGGVLVNLASEEYFKAVRPEKLKAGLVTPVFKEQKGNSFKIIGLFAKKARGEMANWVIRNRLKKPGDLREFTESGYRFREDFSSENQLVFVR